MSEVLRAPAVRGQYDDGWIPARYLRQYYSGSLSDDEAANARFVSRQLKALGRSYTACLEFGCGPTVHHLVNLVPYVGDIHLADYLPENLTEVRRWLTRDARAFDWDPWLLGMLRMEEPTTPPDPVAELERRKSLMRRLTTRVGGADIRSADPLGDGRKFDLIGTWYCLECVGGSRADWLGYLRNLTSLLKPGGVLLMAALRKTAVYHVLGRIFEVTPVAEDDLLEELPRLGYAADGIELEVHAVGDFKEQGIDSICCLRAIKA